MAQTLVEKIAQRYAEGRESGPEVHSQEFLTIRPAHVMTHDNTAAVIEKFRSIQATRVADPTQPVFALDHDIQNVSPDNLAKYAAIEAFAREHGVAFFPAGRGIGHQIMMEEGFVLPGTLVVASDSHANLYGALGALGTPVVRTDAAAIWATGTTWWQVPDVVRVRLTGRLQPGVSGKDVILALVGTFCHDEVLNLCVEFTGDGVTALGMAERMAIANMTTEWGALAGVFPFDDVAHEFLIGRAAVMRERGDRQPRLTREQVERAAEQAPCADTGAVYAKELALDLSAVVPLVAGPNEVKTIESVFDVEARRVRIDKAYLLSCVNGRLEDFADAAAVLQGRRVAEGVAFYIAAASSEVEGYAKRSGYWQTLVGAGAVPLPPGCGPCIGLGDGVLKDGEVGISATNRNFKGRMGSRDAQVYLASPAVVAASAAAGYIAAPDRRDGFASDAREVLGRACTSGASRALTSARPDIDVLEGFPTLMAGELLWVPKDNLNTDGIYGKEFTYQEKMSPVEVGSKAMLNYDPEFQRLAREGDLLVGGYSFGAGSSREQAATALKFRGMQLVIAGSFSQTYKRNAFNNGYVVLECPALVEELREAFAGRPELTIRTGWPAEVDFVRSEIRVEGRRHGFASLGPVAQELILVGGFEALLRQRIERLRT